MKSAFLYPPQGGLHRVAISSTLVDFIRIADFIAVLRTASLLPDLKGEAAIIIFYKTEKIKKLKNFIDFTGKSQKILSIFHLQNHNYVL